MRMTYPTLQTLLEQREGTHKKEMLSAITTDTRHFWQEVGFEAVPMWRGVSDKYSRQLGDRGFAIVKARESRRPMAHSEFRTAMWNKHIHKAGLIADRTNSWLVTGSRAHSSQFGHNVVVVPIGKFHYTWSPDVNDANYALGGEIDGEKFGGRAGSDTIAKFDAGEENPFELLGDDQSLERAINSGNEIMIMSEDGMFLIIDDSVWFNNLNSIEHAILGMGNIE